MRPPNLLFALVLVTALGVKAASAQPALGAQGAEGEPHRLQQWLVPSPNLATAAHAVLFRPPGEGPFPLVLIAHATTQNVLRRAQMPQPQYRALALASEDPKNVAAIVAFAPGRGGHANDFPNRVCAPHTLMAAAGEFGKAARVKVTWLVAANDSYFSPAFSRQLVDAFRGGGGKADFHVLPAHGGEGHWLVETEGGVKLAGPELDRALKARFPTPAKKR